MHDEATVRSAMQGDLQSRETLARAWLRPAYGVALAVTGRAAEAEEVVQEAFVKVFRSLDSLRDPMRFGPWLAQIVRNAARDRARRRHPEPAGDVGRQPARGLAWTDTLDNATVAAWRGLPEDERLIVWLKVVDGMTVRELAHLLDRSKSAVDRALQRGLGRLRAEVPRC